MSADPALGDYLPVAPINDVAQKRNQNLPGQGGVFAPVNLNLYHYAANSPVKFVDPDGEDTYGAGLFLNASEGINLNVNAQIIVDDAGNVGITLSGGAGVAFAIVPTGSAEVGFEYTTTPTIYHTSGPAANISVSGGEVIVATAEATYYGKSGAGIRVSVGVGAGQPVSGAVGGSVSGVAGFNYRKASSTLRQLKSNISEFFRGERKLGDVFRGLGKNPLGLGAAFGPLKAGQARTDIEPEIEMPRKIIDEE